MDADSAGALSRSDGTHPLPKDLQDLSKLQRIHSGSRHRLYRYGRVGDTAVIKLDAAESTGESAAASVRHEFELLRDRELAGIVTMLGLVDTEEGSRWRWRMPGTVTSRNASNRGRSP